MKNLEDLYDVPPRRIRLLGGPHDGEVVPISGRDWPLTWRMPARAPAPAEAFRPPTDDELLQPFHYPTYERTDSVDDQGVRAYRYTGDQ